MATHIQRQRGFTLIELAIVLAVLGILVTGLFQLTTASGRQIQDQATAQQIQQWLRGARTYLGANLDSTTGAVGVTATVVGGTYNITADVQTFRNNTLATTSPQGSTYTTVMRRLPDVTIGATSYPMFALGVFTTGGAATNAVSRALIATLVGAEGASVFDEAIDVIRTAYGAVTVPVSDYVVGPFTPQVNRPAGLAFVSSLDLGNNVSQFLARREVAGAPDMTTMNADLRIGNGAVGTALASGAGVDIVMTDASNDIEMAGGTIYDRLGGDVNFASDIALGANSIVSVAAITATGNIDAAGLTLADDGAIAFNKDGSLFALSPSGTAGDPGLLLSGDMQVTGELRANSFIYDSDRRLKDNIARLDQPLRRLLTVRGVTYDMKTSHEPSMGVLAQDVEKAFPQLVSEDGRGMKGVNYGGLMAPVIESLRQLAAENEALRQRVRHLEQKMEAGR